jgi:hypothetical protein
MKITKSLTKIIPLFIIMVLLDVHSSLKLTQEKTTEWTPEKIIKSTHYKSGYVDPENYVKDFKQISRIYELIMQLRDYKNKIYTTFVIIPKMTTTYTSGGDKDIFSFAEEVSMLAAKNNPKKEAWSIVFIFSIKDRLVAYRVGDEVRKIIDDDTAFEFLKKIVPLMKSENYGGAAISLLEQSSKKIENASKPKPEIKL